MKTLIFEGYSDDTFGEYGVTNQDYDNCAQDTAIHCLITAGKEKMMVTGYYGIHPLDGVWTIGISQAGEGVPLPEWETRFRTPLPGVYTPSLQVDVPDDFTLEWWSDREKVKTS